ncbi:MAG: nuclear transport factor 2 family protein [Cyclobacteriaceae bacterium]|nr:nuclear transport factor 2 family protein [Cyclobacteriaceae bacterium]
MKRIVFFVFLAAPFLIQAQSPEEAVQQVVMSAYVNGIQNNGPIEDIRKGFHPTFAMLRLVDNTVKPFPIDEWIASIEKNRSEGKISSVKTEAKFIQIRVVGTAAQVELELYREGKRIFTDYLLLYQFAEGWRIVSKTYFRHP